MNRLLTLLAALALASPLSAHEVAQGDLQIIHPAIPEPAPNAMTGGGFLTIVNSGTEADRLIAVESDIAEKVALHESKVDTNGVGSMSHVDGIDLPAGGTVALEHGGYHIMFMGLKDPLTAGQMVKGTLVFEKAGRIEVEFEVEPAGMDHDHATDAAD